MSVPAQPVLREGDLVLRADDAEGGTVTFECQWRGEPAGSVELRGSDTGTGRLWWTTHPAHRRRGIASRAVRLLVEHALAEMGLERVEAHVDAEDHPSIRIGLKAGLRREGLLRGSLAGEDGRRDTVVLGRRRADPAPDTREGFIGVLNSTLPTKRSIAQGVIRNASGDVLLCELTYKREWDLPGGVVDPGESPAQCVTREVREELGLEVTPRALLAVNWLPPWRGWSDATAFLFDLGTAPDDLPATAQLQPREIRALHWCDEEGLEERVAPYNQRLLAFLFAHSGGTAYLEDGLPAL
jgi:8-oxo-dGTP pyrophosphatase MutT (NUDIX family)/GNAT superfamily N-acetyltransferase